MNYEYKYIHMEELEPNPKSKRYIVRSNKSGGLLGGITWYAPWGQYCFMANFSCDVVFSAGCLADIADFIKHLMDEGKEGEGREVTKIEVTKIELTKWERETLDLLKSPIPNVRLGYDGIDYQCSMCGRKSKKLKFTRCEYGNIEHNLCDNCHDIMEM